MPEKRNRVVWKDPKTGHEYSAGGILFFDKNGIWVVEEKKGNSVQYTDIGGRYAADDCNIFCCISRELCEETYTTCQLLPRQVEALSRKFTRISLQGTGKTMYMCILVPIHVVDGRVHITVDGKLVHIESLSVDPETFVEARKRSILENPQTYERHFIVQRLVYVPRSDIRSTYAIMSGRLQTILHRGGFL